LDKPPEPPNTPDPWAEDRRLGENVKAKIHEVVIDTSGVNAEEATAWVKELQNVYADMEVEDVKVSGNKISFMVGISGMDEADVDDIKTRVDEYLTMNEAFHVKSINVK
jgi:hypothetical protein